MLMLSVNSTKFGVDIAETIAGEPMAHVPKLSNTTISHENI